MECVLKDSQIEVCFCFVTQRRLVSYIEYPRKISVKPSQDSAHYRERSEETLTDLDGDKTRSIVSRSSQQTGTRRMCQLRIMDDDRSVSTDRHPQTATVQKRLYCRLQSRVVAVVTVVAVVAVITVVTVVAVSSLSSLSSGVVGNVSVRREPTWPRFNGYNHGGQTTRSRRNSRSPVEEVVQAVPSLCATRRLIRPTFVNPHWVVRYIQLILQT